MRAAIRAQQERWKALDKLDTENEYQNHIIETRSVIMNGIRTKELFDCKRGQVGIFVGQENNDPEKAMTYFVRPATRMFRYYFGVCYRVTHEEPYTPEYNICVCFLFSANGRQR